MSTRAVSIDSAKSRAGRRDCHLPDQYRFIEPAVTSRERFVQTGPSVPRSTCGLLLDAAKGRPWYEQPAESHASARCRAFMLLEARL